MIAYFDCFAGISGDMTLGALVDLGVPVDWMKDQLHRLPLANFDLSVTAVQRSGIHAKLVNVEVKENSTLRNFFQIRNLIENSPFSDTVKSISLQIFQKLAEAEARIHDCPLDDVHFHEVDGIDALADIVGTALGLEYLSIQRILASPLPLGRGFVTCRHANLPVPAPATLAILKNIPVYGTSIPHELVTPTGAAIIAATAAEFGAMQDIIIHKIGYGAGQRDLKERPNLLRIILATDSQTVVANSQKMNQDKIDIIETSIDDMNPEWFGYLMERLFEDGALDVCWIPIHMKKNRPGTLLQVLCGSDRRDILIHRILSESTTLGVRFYPAYRRLLWRDQLEVKTTYGTVAVKRIRDPAGRIRLVPEYDVCRQIAREKDLPLRVVYDTIAREAFGMTNQRNDD